MEKTEIQRATQQLLTIGTECFRALFEPTKEGGKDLVTAVRAAARDLVSVSLPEVVITGAVPNERKNQRPTEGSNETKTQQLKERVSEPGAELLKKFETQAPRATKMLTDAAKEAVHRLREGLESKGPVSAEAKAKAIEALNKLGDTVRGLRNADGTKLTTGDQAKLVAALLTKEMARTGMGDYRAVASAAQPRSGEFAVIAIEKRDEKVGNRSLSVSVPLSTASGERSDTAEVDVTEKTPTGAKVLDTWIPAKPRK